MDVAPEIVYAHRRQPFGEVPCGIETLFRDDAPGCIRVSEFAELVDLLSSRAFRDCPRTRTRSFAADNARSVDHHPRQTIVKIAGIQETRLDNKLASVVDIPSLIADADSREAALKRVHLAFGERGKTWRNGKRARRINESPSILAFSNGCCQPVRELPATREAGVHDLAGSVNVLPVVDHPAIVKLATVIP